MRIIIILLYNLKIMKFDIQVANVEKIVPVLEVLLASEYVAALKLKNYHWNVISRRFFGNHAYFEDAYNEANERIDEIAERIRTLGVFAKGTMAEYLELSLIKEETSKNLSDIEMLTNTGNDKVVILKALKEAVELASELGDVGTESLLTGFVETYEKDLWKLNSMDL